MSPVPATTWRPPKQSAARQCGLFLVSAAASVSAYGQGLSIKPTVSIVETLTDNRDTRADRKQWDLITLFSPGIVVQSPRGALQGSLSYSFNGVSYARDSSLNSTFHGLSGTGLLSLVDGRAGVRLAANAGQNQISAFGVQNASSSQSSRNQAQTVSYSLSPYVQGVAVGSIRYSASLTASRSSSDAEAKQGDSEQLVLAAQLSGPAGRLGWTTNLNLRRTDQASGKSGRTGQLTGGLTFTPDVDWNFSARAGREFNDIRTGSDEQSMTWGYGAAWQPGPRSSLRFDTDRRFFGRSHALNFSHRMAATVWTLSDTRNLNTSGVAGRAETTLYEMLFALSREPDPVKRDLEVRAFLQEQGRSADEKVIVGGFLTSSATIDRRQQAAVTYRGLRVTVSLSAFVGRTTRASASADAEDDLTGGSVRQRGWTSTLNYRLTPRSSLALSLRQQHTGSNATRDGNDLRSLLATWSGSLGPDATASLALRHTVSDGNANAYTENALIGSIQMRF